MLFPSLCFNELHFILNLIKSETMNWLTHVEPHSEKLQHKITEN